VDVNDLCMIAWFAFEPIRKLLKVFLYFILFFYSQGFEWQHLRSKLTTQLASTALGDHTIKQLCIISDELIEKIQEERIENIVDGFEKVIYRCGLEGNIGTPKAQLTVLDLMIRAIIFSHKSYFCHFVWPETGRFKQELDPMDC
jgi:hypothetical protein